MTSRQIDELRAAIDARRAALAAEIRRDVDRARGEQFGEIAGPVRDRGDEAVADLLADVNQADLSRDARELGELTAALRRVR